jgi:hypothetical protein
MKKFRELFKRWSRGDQIEGEVQFHIPMPIIFLGGAIILFFLIRACL